MSKEETSSVEVDSQTRRIYKFCQGKGMKKKDLENAIVSVLKTS